MNNWSSETKGCFTSILFGLFYFVSIFTFFPYGLLAGSAVFLLRNRVRFSNFYFVAFYFICLSGFWLGFRYGFLIGLGVFLIRIFQNREEEKELKKHKLQAERQIETKEQTRKKPTKLKRITKFKRIKEEFKERLKKNSEPDEIENYRECKIKIYNLSEKNQAFKIINWDNITLNAPYFTIRAAKNAIGNLYPSELTKEEYLAEKEKKLRKQEQDAFLARAYQQRQKISTLKSNLTTIDDLFNLTPIEFEKWVRLHIFEKEGWSVTETKATGDGGIDLALNRKGEHSIAQCKRYRNTVGEPLLRDFYGTMMSEGVSKGYFVTTGLFSLSALKFAENKPIILIDRRLLAKRLG